MINLAALHAVPGALLPGLDWDFRANIGLRHGRLLTRTGIDFAAGTLLPFPHGRSAFAIARTFHCDDDGGSSDFGGGESCGDRVVLEPTSSLIAFSASW